MAAAEIFQLRIVGKGGHGAIPNLTVDPVLASAQVITALQSIPARNVSPLQSAVISVTAIHGGETFNVIPPAVDLQGTIRTFEPVVREQVLKRFREVVSGVSQAMGCQAEVDTRLLTPAVINDSQVSARVRDVAVRTLPDCVIDDNFHTMGSEDMAFMMQAVPSCFFFVGSASSEKGLDAPHHHPRFDFDEQALPRAVALIAAAAADYLS
jgi:amidohydrolase